MFNYHLLEKFKWVNCTERISRMSLLQSAAIIKLLVTDSQQLMAVRLGSESLALVLDRGFARAVAVRSVRLPVSSPRRSVQAASSYLRVKIIPRQAILVTKLFSYFLNSPLDCVHINTISSLSMKGSCGL